jgi:hypothetical protein
VSWCRFAVEKWSPYISGVAPHEIEDRIYDGVKRNFVSETLRMCWRYDDLCLRDRLKGKLVVLFSSWGSTIYCMCGGKVGVSLVRSCFVHLVS